MDPINIDEAYRTLGELMSDYAYAFRVEPDGSMTLEWVTPGFHDITGYRDDEVALRDGWDELIHADDRDVGLRRRDALLSGHDDVSEFRIVAKSGDIHWLREAGRPVRDESGDRVIAVYGAGVDITEHERAEEQLRQFKTISDRASYGVAISDLEGNLLYVNDTFAKMHGSAAEKLIGENLSLFHAEEQMQRVRALNERLRHEGSYNAEEVWHQRQDGQPFPTLMHATIVKDEKGTPLFMSATVVDITDRKRADEALRESEQRYRSLVENIHLGITLINPDHEILMTNAAQGRMFNKPVCEFVGKKCFAEFEKRDAVCTHCPGTRAMATGKPAEAETEGVLDDGSHLSVRIQAFPILGPDDTPTGFIEVVEDITERKRTAAALRESEEQFRTVVGASKDAMIAIDSEGSTTLFNPAAEEMFGRKEEDMIGRSLDDLMPEEHRERHRQYVKGFFATGEPHGTIGRTIELPALRSNGEVFPVELSLSTGRREHEQFILAVIRDVTERKQMEELVRRRQEELAHVSRLSTMGEIATGLAHELNQPLAAITAYSQGCLRRIQGGSVTPQDLVKPVEQIAAQASRAGRVIRRIRDFVSRRELQRASVDINELIQEAVGLMDYEVRNREVRIQLELSGSLPPASADRVQIQQVVVNLLLNAMDALSAAETRDRTVRVYTAAARTGAIEVAVCDSGPGISPDIADRIFDPFFTTRKGNMGMGLAICRSIITDHDGRLWAAPGTDGGISFRFTLPQANAGPDVTDKPSTS